MQFPHQFTERMQLLLGDEYAAFLSGYQLPLRRGLRINNHKISTDAFLEVFPHPLSPSPFAKNSFYLDAEHKAGSDPLHVIAWRDIYRCLEGCADACEHVSECVGSVIMKNT